LEHFEEGPAKANHGISRIASDTFKVSFFRRLIASRNCARMMNVSRLQGQPGVAGNCGGNIARHYFYHLVLYYSTLLWYQVKNTRKSWRDVGPLKQMALMCLKKWWPRQMSMLKLGQPRVEAFPDCPSEK